MRHLSELAAPEPFLLRIDRGPKTTACRPAPYGQIAPLPTRRCSRLSDCEFEHLLGLTSAACIRRPPQNASRFCTSQAVLDRACAESQKEVHPNAGRFTDTRWLHSG